MLRSGTGMRGSGQRQDVAMLALGVSALAIAVAIMAGLRTVSQVPKQAGKTTPAASAPPTSAPAVPAPKADRTRDPFLDQSKGQRGREAAGRGRETREEEFRLVGLVSGRHAMAVIRRGSRRYYVRVGEKVGPFTLAAIGPDQVTLTRGEERVVLRLKRPEGEGGT